LIFDVPNQIAQYGWETGQAEPSPRSPRQRVEWLAAEDGWVCSGLVFTRLDGSPYHPADVTDHFHFLVRRAGLPPVRLHDLRHGAATLALAAGVEMKVVQAMLRHASESTTSRFYANVLPAVARDAAERTALIIPRASVRRLGLG
jgi:integrase